HAEPLATPRVPPPHGRHRRRPAARRERPPLLRGRAQARRGHRRSDRGRHAEGTAPVSSAAVSFWLWSFGALGLWSSGALGLYCGISLDRFISPGSILARGSCLA